MGSSGLSELIHRHLAAQGYDGLLEVSMDHSPSEQLDGQEWHTTVLILSKGFKHDELANELARRANPSTASLTKWSKANSHYQERFLTALTSSLPQFPVYIFAISAKEAAIKKSEQHFVMKLGLSNHYKKIEKGNGKTSVDVGPFVRMPAQKAVSVQISENRAMMVLFVFHFAFRMYQQMLTALNPPLGPEPTHLNWHFFGDKFPGPLGDNMDLMFQILAGLNQQTGQLQWGYFKESDTVASDLLADNLAGLLNETINSQERLCRFSLPASSPTGGLFYWEHWDR